MAPPPPSSSASLYEFLSRGFCGDCSRLLKSRIDQLDATGALNGLTLPIDRQGSWSLNGSDPSSSSSSPEVHTPATRVSASPNLGSAVRKWLSADVSRGSPSSSYSSDAAAVDEGLCDDLVERRDESREWMRMKKVVRKKDFRLVERLKGRDVNVLQGLELHTNVFNVKEQEKIVYLVYHLQKLGRERKLRDRTYSEPRKWMPGKGRVTLQFGCCYNYAEDKDGNPPGIIREEEVDPLPPLFKLMIQRMVRWRILPPSCVPNSCIVNIYDKGDCIPPHIDHHDFLRPFCTISFLAECNILFGHSIKIAGPGEFDAPIAIPLPVGSVFVLNGNGADVAKHCVPGVPAKRISITFRKMDPAKIPYSYSPDPKLEGLKPLAQTPTASPSPVLQPTPRASTPNPQGQPQQHEHQRSNGSLRTGGDSSSISSSSSNGISKLTINDNDFPPLGGSSVTSKRMAHHS